MTVMCLAVVKRCGDLDVGATVPQFFIAAAQDVVAGFQIWLHCSLNAVKNRPVGRHDDD